jgi:hypothetical protein
MNNNLLQIKIMERLNKLASHDYDNIECWQISEAFNKAQIQWMRRQLRGYNPKREGDGSSKDLIDDLQGLLKTFSIRITKMDRYYETATLPADYLSFKSVSIKANDECCQERPMVVYLVEAADVDVLLEDQLTKPSFEWGETFAVLMGKKLRIYTNNAFDLSSPILTYYKKPRQVAFKGCTDISSGNIINTSVTCEFNDDVAEILVDETASILAADMEMINQKQILTQRVSNNT